MRPTISQSDSRGRIYFTDPRYGDRSDMQIVDTDGKAIEGVYRIDGANRVTQILTHEVDRPNGIAISPDEKYLFVADNNNSSSSGNRKLWRFDLRPDGSITSESRKLLFDWGTDRGPDGMTIGPRSRLYVAAGRNYQVDETETASKYKAAVYVDRREWKTIRHDRTANGMTSQTARLAVPIE